MRTIAKGPANVGSTSLRTNPNTTSPVRQGALADGAGYQTIVTDPVISQYGSVSELSDASGSFFVLEFAPVGADTTYVIGDPFDIIEFAGGATWSEPTRSTTSSIAGLKSSFVNAQVIVGVNYEATSAAQFGQQMRRVSGDNSGAFQSKPLNVQGAQRNTQYNDKLLTIKFPGGLRMDQYNAITLTVLDGQTVTATFFVGAASS
jgi:hypothetical protein